MAGDKKSARQRSQTQERSSPFRVVDPLVDDNSRISLPFQVLALLGLKLNDTVLVRNREKGRETVLRVFPNFGSLEVMAGINSVVKKNLRVGNGDIINVYPLPDIKFAVRVAISPIADTIRGLTGSFDNFLVPYFKDAYRPLVEGDLFTCRGSQRMVEFKVMEIDPRPYAIVGSDAIIHCEGEPLAREDVANPICYDHFGGYKPQVKQFQQLVQLFIDYPEVLKYRKIRPPRGILISGPAGTGKTLMAKAIIDEHYGTYFYFCPGSELPFQSASNENSVTSKVFGACLENEPAVLIIDKIESIYPTVDDAQGGQHHVLSQVISEMDHLKPQSRLLIIATTSLPDAVLADLRGFGRFDHEIRLGLPETADRLDILRIHTKNFTLDTNVSLETVAASTDGCVGSDLALLCQKAALNAMSRDLSTNWSEGEISTETFESFVVRMEDFRTAVSSLNSVVTKTQQVSSDSNEKSLSPTDYTVAIICPMGVELAPVEAMLDEIHDTLSTHRDLNAYTMGSIGKHNVVVAVMPETGNNAATSVALQLLNDFPLIRFGLLVGIGGGVPGNADVRLGDVVISQPTSTFGGVVQYDLGKVLPGGRFQRTGSLNKPPPVLCASVQKLEARHRRIGSQIPVYLQEMIQRYPRMQREYSVPTHLVDRLYSSNYPHQYGKSCEQCDPKQIVSRNPRPDTDPYVHYGTIGSANLLVRDAAVRDGLKQDMDILCVEMEAAGLMNTFPCLVIRGISDYADSHKNKSWQPYAAAVAAAYMRELLLVIPAQQVMQTRNAVDSAVHG